MEQSEIHSYPAIERSSQTALHWPSVFQFGLSLLAFITLFTFSVSLAALGLMQVFNPAIFIYDTAPIFLMSAGTALSSFLLLPSAWYALLRLIGRPSAVAGRLGLFARRLTRPAVLVPLIVLVVLLGDFVSRSDLPDWLGLPLVHGLAVGLPVLLLAYLGWRGLPTGSLQRSWGVFASGLVLGPALTLAAELVAILVLVFLGILYISLRPDLAQEMMVLGEQIEQFRGAPDQALSLITPYLSQPAVIFVVFSFTAGLVPLIEELFKPVGVWLLVGRRLYMDVSHCQGEIDDEQARRILLAHPPEYLLFGSDAPWSDPGGTRDWIRRLLPDQRRLEALFHDNAVRLLGLEETRREPG